MDVQHLGPVLPIFFQLAFELCTRILEGILAVGLLFRHDFGQARGVHFGYDFLSERECVQLMQRRSRPLPPALAGRDSTRRPSHALAWRARFPTSLERGHLGS